MADKKVVINCPGCKHRVRVPKYKNLTFICPKCKNQVSYNGKINKKPFYIGGLLLLLLISYFAYFGDYFAYQNVKEELTKSACTKYYNSYPNGYFLEEVSFIEITLDKDIELVRDFLKTYPDSKNKEEVLKINQGLWNSEIDAYNKDVTSKKGLDAKAINFFRSLLEFMRDHNESTILLNLEGNVDVKNFDKYSANVKNKLDSVISSVDNRNVSDNIAPITSNYRRGNMKLYESIINSAVESSFENILSHNFIKVTSNTTFKSPLKINIYYDIKNQEQVSLQEKDTYPIIWTYNRGEKKEEFISYLIGVSINYTFSIKLPESDKEFKFDYKTNALNNIRNINNIKEGYSRMTAQNFHNYSEIISTKFGLSTAEAKEE